MSMIVSCDETTVKDKSSSSGVVSGKIKLPAASGKPVKQSKAATIKPDPSGPKPVRSDVPEKKQPMKVEIADHYDASGKIDPFKALIQETPEPVKAAFEKKPKRLLTPLEKIELSQIRLVAVIITKKRRMAMVEEASGKGYEVGVGTFIGRGNGIITQIKESSIVVKEPVRDFKGRLSERIQEIKIHKKDIED